MAGLLTTAIIYLHGWRDLRKRDSVRWTFAQPTALFCGLATLYAALASPIEPFSSLLLQVHMLQHLLLMMVVAPLVWLGAPQLPLLRGLPRTIRRDWLAPLLRLRTLHTFLSWITHPLVALPLFVASTWLWHVPTLYDAALRSPEIHYLQHVSFVASALIFWYPVVRPFPARPRWSPWLLLPYLLLADIQNTVLSAMFTFSDRVLYPYYAEVPRITSATALDDQAAAGVLMWVPGSIAFLGPLFWIGTKLLYGEHKQASARPSRLQLLPILAQDKTRDFDLLHVPLIGALLGWRYARVVSQTLLAIVAAAMIYDGLTGPQIGAMNLAGVLPWIHWRGLLMFGLLVAGNFFCFACPFTLPRAIARRWLPRGKAWPRALRSKWLAVGLIALFLWTYEAFSLWDSPWITAWIAIGYFVAAFAIEIVYRGGTFCKYVCPIGQFNFVQSLFSPLQVGVRQANVCASCTTHECIRGSEMTKGCELLLFQPRKSGNMDCNFCLDCVKACPHENVGILATNSVAELWSERWRSGVGQWSNRTDIAALIYLLTFGAFANAAGMVEPVVRSQDEWTLALGQGSHLLATTLFYAIAIIALPLGTVAIAALLNGLVNGIRTSRKELATRFAFAMVPLGFAMWLAHYSFHFLTSFETIVPVTQRFMGDLGLYQSDPPAWSCACCRGVSNGLIEFELVALGVGFVLSLFVCWKIADSLSHGASMALKLVAPWAGLLLLLYMLGVWIVFQPMQMRGTLPGGG